MHLIHCLTHSDLGGGQEAVYTQVRYLVTYQPGMTISVILPEGGVYVDRFRSLGVNVHTFPLNRLSVRNFGKFLALVKSLGPDIVHSHGKGAGLYSRLRPDGGHWKRVHSYHGFHPPRVLPIASAYSALERFLLRHTDAIVVVSPSEEAEISRRFPSIGGRIHTITNIIDPAELERQSKAELTPETAEFFKRNPGSNLVTMIARQDPVKNYPLALETMEQVLAQRGDITFLLVGVDTHCPSFRRLAGLFPGRIHGKREYSPIAPLLSRTSIMLLTSKKEGGLPLVLQEGFSFGKPAVATDVDGIHDLVKHNINGLLCPATPDAMASAILKLCAEQELYHRLSVQARRTTSDQAPRDFVRQYMTVYEFPVERASG
jgi:glycosyltransferase involved in cell wall biosynthesis